MLQAVFSRILQSSGQIVDCQPDVSSAALNFDWWRDWAGWWWGKHTFLYSPLLFHTRLHSLGIILLGSFRVRKWWVGRRTEEWRTLWGKAGCCCGFLNSHWGSISGWRKVECLKDERQCIVKRSKDWEWGSAEPRAKAQWNTQGEEGRTLWLLRKLGPSVERAELPWATFQDVQICYPPFGQGEAIQTVFQQCPPSSSEESSLESEPAHLASHQLSSCLKSQTHQLWSQPRGTDLMLSYWLCPE